MRILGTGRALPAKCARNEELAAFLETSDEWIVSHTGIRERRVCTNESLTDLAEAAGREALRKAGLTGQDIGLVIGATISGEYTTPSVACCVSERMGLSCTAFDVNAACSGFIYALELAGLYIDAGKAKYVLIIACEELTRHVDWSDRSTCPLFGDGAGAAVVGPGNALRYIRLTAEGNTAPLYMKAGAGSSVFRPEQPHKREYLQMRGQEVFKFAVQAIEKEAGLAFAALNLQPEDVNLYFLHQANRRIIESARLRLRLPESKFPINIDRYGNMSSASIPILLDETLEDGRIAKGDILFMSAFGAGMTTGTCVWFWE